MSPGVRQAALTLLFVGAIGLIGSAQRPTPVLPGPGPDTTSSTAPSRTQPSRSTPTTLAFVESVSSPRTVTVRAFPSDVGAEITVTDDSGSTTGTGSVGGSLVGDVTVEVEADGYRPETHSLEAGYTGTFEIFLDPSDQLVDRTMAIVTGAAPKQVAFTPDGSELWVTLLAGTGLEVYDPRSGRELAAIDLPEAGSVEVVFDATGATAWVSQMETARVYEIDVDTHRVRRHLDTGGSWTKVMVLSPDETRLWASNWVSNDVSEFDLQTGEMTRRIPTVLTPRGLATDESGARLYVAGYESGDLQVIDLETGQGDVIHTTAGAMRHLVRDPDSGLIYASDMARDLVLTVDPATGRVQEFVDTDRLPNTIDLTPDGEVLAVSNRGANHPESYHLPGPEWGSVLLFDTSTGEMLDAVVAGNQPTGLDVSADGEWMAYSDFLDNRVTVLSLPSAEELREGGGGRSAAYRPELRK